MDDALAEDTVGNLLEELFGDEAEADGEAPAGVAPGAPAAEEPEAPAGVAPGAHGPLGIWVLRQLAGAAPGPELPPEALSPLEALYFKHLK